MSSDNATTACNNAVAQILTDIPSALLLHIRHRQAVETKRQTTKRYVERTHTHTHTWKTRKVHTHTCICIFTQQKQTPEARGGSERDSIPVKSRLVIVGRAGSVTLTWPSFESNDPEEHAGAQRGPDNVFPISRRGGLRWARSITGRDGRALKPDLMSGFAFRLARYARRFHVVIGIIGVGRSVTGLLVPKGRRLRLSDPKSIGPLGLGGPVISTGLLPLGDTLKFCCDLEGFLFFTCEVFETVNEVYFRLAVDYDTGHIVGKFYVYNWGKQCLLYVITNTHSLGILSLCVFFQIFHKRTIIRNLITI